MLKKAVCGYMLAALLAALILPAAALAAPSDSAGSCILIHEDSGRVLYAHNEHDRMLIASTTKIMTALVVLDNCDVGESVQILPEFAAVEGSSMYLMPGNSYTVEELLYGMLLASGNDAAAALAHHAGGDIEGFAELMNNKAKELGLGDTRFENPHGLDGASQYSSACDMAKLTAAALKNDAFAKIVGTKTYTVGENTYINHNKLLWSCPGVTGVKTGYTIAAGRTLVSRCERNGLRLICVTLSDADDWNDHRALYDWAYSSYEYAEALPEGVSFQVSVISGKKDSIRVVPESGLFALIETGAELQYRVELPKFVYASVRRGERAGRLVVLSNGNEAGEIPLIFAESVELQDGLRRGRLGRFFNALTNYNNIGYILSDGK